MPFLGHRDLDRPRGSAAAGTLGRPQGGLTCQGRRPAQQHGSPRLLQPGRYAGVVDVHPGVQAHERPAPHQPIDVVLAEPALEELPAGHDARLVSEEGVHQRMHESHGPDPPGAAPSGRAVLWTIAGTAWLVDRTHQMSATNQLAGKAEEPPRRERLSRWNAQVSG